MLHNLRRPTRHYGTDNCTNARECGHADLVLAILTYNRLVTSGVGHILSSCRGPSPLTRIYLRSTVRGVAVLWSGCMNHVVTGASNRCFIFFIEGLRFCWAAFVATTRGRTCNIDGFCVNSIRAVTTLRGRGRLQAAYAYNKPYSTKRQ